MEIRTNEDIEKMAAGNLQVRNEPDSPKHLIKYFGHVLYMVSSVVVASAWLGGYSATSEINPLRQWQVLEQRAAEKRETRGRTDSLYEEIFGERGLADADKNGRISASEKARAYEIMGLEDKIKVNVGELATSEQLQKAKEFYEKESRGKRK